MAVPKPNFPVGTLDIGADKRRQSLARHDVSGGVAKFDPKTEQFQYFSLPPERQRDNSQLNMVTPDRIHVDGKLWVNDAGPSTLFRLDVATGKFEEFDPLSMLPGGRKGPYSIYDVRADSAEQRLCDGLPAQLRGASGRQDRKRSPPSRPPTSSRATGAAASTIRIGSGSPSIAATGSRCSTPRSGDSRNIRCRPSSRSPMT